MPQSVQCHNFQLHVEAIPCVLRHDSLTSLHCIGSCGFTKTKVHSVGHCDLVTSEGQRSLSENGSLLSDPDDIEPKDHGFVLGDRYMMHNHNSRDEPRVQTDRMQAQQVKYSRVACEHTSNWSQQVLLLDSVRVTGMCKAGSFPSELCCMPAFSCSSKGKSRSEHGC